MATIKKTNKIEVGDFGPIYNNFVNKPKLAIKHLKKVKKGECVNALYRSDIGYIDIVWGENNVKTNKGFGLKHIIDKHGSEIKKLGFEVEDFIPIIVQFGNLKESKSKEEYLLESKMFRVVIEKQYKQKKKQWILTAFDLTKKPKLKK